MSPWKRDPVKGLVIGSAIVAHTVSTIQYARIYPGLEDTTSLGIQLLSTIPFAAIPALWMVLIAYSYFWYTDTDTDDEADDSSRDDPPKNYQNKTKWQG